MYSPTCSPKMQPCAVGDSIVLETNLAWFASQCSSWRLFPGLTVLEGEHESTVDNKASRLLPVDMDGGTTPKRFHHFSDDGVCHGREISQG